ncbi:MAG: hypothetical protein CMJ40_07780 [Phycisphaerae bacterium]|nr:hypothetical protein [Phycisphaerae bacterium]
MRRDVIQGDEEIVLITRPSAWFVVLYPLKMILLIIVIAILVGVVCSMLNVTGLGGLMAWSTIWLLAALTIVLVLGWSLLEWRFHVYTLTTRRVLTSTGVVRRTLYETSLVHLRQTMVHVSIGERCVGVGSLLFATAGTAYYDTVWSMLSDPSAVQQKVQNLSRRSERS